MDKFTALTKSEMIEIIGGAILSSVASMITGSLINR